jgi:hypothetical protein
LAAALAEEHGFNEVSYRLALPQAREHREGHRMVAEPSHRRLARATTAVITAIDALVDVGSSRVLA